MFCPLVMFHIENNTPEDTTSAIEDQNFKKKVRNGNKNMETLFLEIPSNWTELIQYSHFSHIPSPTQGTRSISRINRFI